MSLEICGMIGTRHASEIDGAGSSLVGGHIEPGYVRDFARAHEASGFDRVLIGYGSSGPDGFSVASYAASVTERLTFMIAHRPGFVVPTLAARKVATLDQFTQGRISLNIITGGTDAEQQRDGDFLDHDTRYRRTDEYLEVMRKVWTSDVPFDHEGEFYRFKSAYSEVKCHQKPAVPLYYGGMSAAAIPVGARHADTYMFWGEPLSEVKAQMSAVRTEAAKWGREPKFSVSVRPIVASTESAAWEKAQRFLERAIALRKDGSGHLPKYRPQNTGSQRLLSLADRGEVHDKRLWTAIAAAVGAAGNTTALVGTPEQVAEAILDYYDLGVSTILIRGFEPLPDAVEWGKELIPAIRAGVAARDRARAAVG